MLNRDRYLTVLGLDALIGLTWWLGAHIMPESWWWVTLIGLHAALPFFAVRLIGAARAWRAFAIGPGAVLAVYAALLVRYVIELWGGFPEDIWIALLLSLVCALAIAVFLAYAVAVTAYLQRRAARRP